MQKLFGQDHVDSHRYQDSEYEPLLGQQDLALARQYQQSQKLNNVWANPKNLSLGAFLKRGEKSR